MFTPKCFSAGFGPVFLLVMILSFLYLFGSLLIVGRIIVASTLVAVIRAVKPVPAIVIAPATSPRRRSKRSKGRR